MEVIKGYTLFYDIILMSLGIEEDFKMWKQNFLNSLFNTERSRSVAKDSTLTSDTQTEDSKHVHESAPKSEVRYSCSQFNNYIITGDVRVIK